MLYTWSSLVSSFVQERKQIDYYFDKIKSKKMAYSLVPREIMSIQSGFKI